jgi:hypothetical protein
VNGIDVVEKIEENLPVITAFEQRTYLWNWRPWESTQLNGNTVHQLGILDKNWEKVKCWHDSGYRYV